MKNLPQHLLTGVLAAACIGLLVYNMIPRPQTLLDETVTIKDNQVYWVTLDVPVDSLLTTTVTTADGKKFDFTVWTEDHYTLVREAMDRPTAAAFEAVAEQNAAAFITEDAQTAVNLAEHSLAAGKYVIEVANAPAYENGPMAVALLIQLKKK
jgi:hypothetical protein